MDENKSRERIVSILNNNDCPSFTIRRKDQLPVERPSLARQAHYTGRNSSYFSTTTPPLLRFDSSSSTSSKSSVSMDSSPSPITPAYNYNDGMLPYTDLVGYLPSPTTITPFMEQQMMISASQPGQLMLDYAQKSMPQLAPAAAYPLIPVTQVQPESISIEPRVPSLTSDNSTSTSTNSKSSPSIPSAANFSQKKNKYPCPYTSSHNCSATFTTSGHAARHGKKHTGEKGVHCPVCNKAFTRKDNMKQHERTHKHGSAGSVLDSVNDSTETTAPRKSKAAITKEAAKAKSQRSTTATTASDQASHCTLSPLSTVASLGPTSTDQSAAQLDPMFSSHTSLLPLQPTNMPLDDALLQLQPEPLSTSLYPPLSDNLSNINNQNDVNSTIILSTLQGQPQSSQLQPVSLATHLPQMPALIRRFSDLDTLAQAAAQEFPPESYYATM